MKFSEVSSTFLRENYLFGVPLEDMYGNKMKEGMLEHYIKSAVHHTQRMLQIEIEPVTIDREIHDYYGNDMGSWGFFQLHKRPILEVTHLSLRYGNRDMVEIPTSWIKSYANSGQIQLFPDSGSAGGMALTAGGQLMPLMTGMYHYAPSMWHVSYRAGMDDLPDDMVEYIMKRASVGILQVWGDLIIGAGIANQTISIDGLSQSIGTTQSPEFSGAGARIKNYMDDMKELERRLKDTYLGINMGIL
jgi:hypothetical protein